MPKLVLTAAYVSLNSVDRSGYTKKLQLATEVEEKDVTTFADLGWKVVIGGLKSGTLAATFNQDIATGLLDETMWPLLGSVVPFEVRLLNTAVGASNPKYTGSVLVKTWTPAAGGVGDVAEVDVSWPTSGVITRATS